MGESQDGASSSPLPLACQRQAIVAAARALRSGDPSMLLLGGAALRVKRRAGDALRPTPFHAASEFNNARGKAARTRPVDRFPYPVDNACRS